MPTLNGGATDTGLDKKGAAAAEEEADENSDAKFLDLLNGEFFFFFFPVSFGRVVCRDPRWVGSCLSF